jgi:integrase
MQPKETFSNVVMPNLKANSEYSRFWYRFEYEKKAYRGVIDLSKKDLNKRDRIMVAKREFIAIREKVEAGISEDATVDFMVDKYFETLKEGEYKKYRKIYYDNYVKKEIGYKKINSIIPDQIQKIVDGLIKKGHAPKTAKQAVEVLSPAFRIARANRVMFYNPCEDVHIKMKKTKKIVSSASERLKALYEAIMELYHNDPMYRALFLLALQGRRRGEIFDLKVEDVSFEHNYYIIRDTKNGEDQKIHLPPKAKEAMLEFMDKSGLVFKSKVTGRRINTLHGQVLKIRAKVGDWFTMHYTRNLIVSALAEKGVDSIHLSGALGHSDTSTVLKYLSLNYTIGSRMASDLMEDTTIIE